MSHLTSSVIRRLEGLGPHDERQDMIDVDDNSAAPSVNTSGSPSPRPGEHRVLDADGQDEEDDPSGKNKKKVSAGSGLLGIGGVRQSKWEIPRKILHTSIGFGTLYLYLYPPPPAAASPFLGYHDPQTDLVPTITKILLSSLAVIVPADALRLLLPHSTFALLYNTLLGFLMRPSEVHSVNGVVYYIVGVAVSLSAYEKKTAVYSVLALSWADTMASTVGRMYGRQTGALPWSKGKSWAGFFGACVVGAALAACFWPKGELMVPLLAKVGVDVGEGWIARLVLAVYAGLTTGMAESVAIGEWLDDNLTLPILSGAALWVLGLF